MATLRGVKHAEPLQPGSVLEKAVKDSYSSLDNCYHVVIYGAQVTESHVHDFEILNPFKRIVNDSKRGTLGID